MIKNNLRIQLTIKKTSFYQILKFLLFKDAGKKRHILERKKQTRFYKKSKQEKIINKCFDYLLRYLKLLFLHSVIVIHD